MFENLALATFMVGLTVSIHLGGLLGLLCLLGSAFGKLGAAARRRGHHAVSCDLISPETDGLHYRTRVQLNVDASGTAGPMRPRSNEAVFTSNLPLAVTEIEELGLQLKNFNGVKKVSIAASSTGDLQWMVDDKAWLSFLKTSSIEVRDTALGRHRETKKRELLASIALMTEQELKSMQQKITMSNLFVF